MRAVHEALDPEYSILKQRLARRMRYEGMSEEDVTTMDLVQVTKVRTCQLRNAPDDYRAAIRLLWLNSNCCCSPAPHASGCLGAGQLPHPGIDNSDEVDMNVMHLLSLLPCAINAKASQENGQSVTGMQ